MLKHLIDYKKKFHNLKSLEILNGELFKPRQTSKRTYEEHILRIAKEYGVELPEPKSLFLHLEIQKAWLVDFHFDILTTKLCSNPMIYYLLSDLYQLVLGNYAPNVQLIHFDSNLGIAIEFIDNFETLKVSNKVCQNSRGIEDFPNCQDTVFANYYTIAALAIITGELDLHEANIGIISPISSPTLLAKIDHDKNICHRNLTFQDRVFESLGLNRLNKDSINHLDCLAYGMQNIINIPDDLWQNAINRRWNMLENIKHLLTHKAQNHLEFIKELKDDLLIIKSKLPIWQDALTLEHFVLEEDMDNLQNYLSIQNIDINSTYDFIGLSSHRTHFSFFFFN